MYNAYCKRKLNSSFSSVISNEMFERKKSTWFDNVHIKIDHLNCLNSVRVFIRYVNPILPYTRVWDKIRYSFGLRIKKKSSPTRLLIVYKNRVHRNVIRDLFVNYENFKLRVINARFCRFEISKIIIVCPKTCKSKCVKRPRITITSHTNGSKHSCVKNCELRSPFSHVYEKI